jgi:F-type H+-transporting ATPase subunit b
MGLITPDYGLLFWMLLSFSILLFILKKFAWKPILQGIKNREEQISKSLREAEMARNEIAKLQVQIDEMAKKAQLEREQMMQDARKLKEKMIEEAGVKAQEEAQKLMAQARESIRREKEAAQAELKAYTSKIVLQVAELILRKELDEKGKHEEQVNALIKELSSLN